MTASAYPAARAVAGTIEAHFREQAAAARSQAAVELGPVPDASVVEAVLSAGFWASLQREEGRSPQISLAYLPPELGNRPLMLERRLALLPANLTALAPAVERPGIHLGVWRDAAGLYVWGATRTIPALCMVLEVVEPGLLVVKHRRREEFAKFANVAVLQGDQVRVVDEAGGRLPDCPEVITSLLAQDVSGGWGNRVNVLVQLAASMRAHGRGGSLLIVPGDSDAWRESIVHPIRYAVAPAFSRLAELARPDAPGRGDPAWQEALGEAVAGIAGLTAVDGAVVLTDRFELLAFGAKISRRSGSPPVEQVVVTEPVVGVVPAAVHAAHLGGTRHLSAAQFVCDQPDALALIASQDGRFTIFSWSPCEQRVHAHRVEALLL